MPSFNITLEMLDKSMVLVHKGKHCLVILKLTRLTNDLLLNGPITSLANTRH